MGESERVLGARGLTVEANVVVSEDDRSLPLRGAPHGDMDNSKSCLDVMLLQREDNSLTTGATQPGADSV